ncbi:PorP/SprF family type IX secretion system membrane protein [Pollutibacter soli]|uniref:PorP/SprF family type IX secretion system membrane protein n=1 Tax=Pollutibacter soli TaxID=3034157 RepID=UPI003013E3CA
MKKFRLPFRQFFAIVAGVFMMGETGAQDLHFSQFFEAPLLRNPSLAGLFEGDIRVQGVYRNQWNSISFPYQTGSLNADYKFPVGKGDDFMTLGIQTLFDKAGTVALNTTYVMPAVNFHKAVSATRNSFLSLGFMGGIVSRRLDRSKVTTNNQYDGFGYNGSLPDGETFVNNYSYFDASVGMSFNSTLGSEEQHTYFIGLAYHHFTKPVNSFYRNINHLPKWVVSGGLKMFIDPFSYVTFHADYSRQDPFEEVIFGGMYSRKLGDEDVPTVTVHGGLYYRLGDAVIPVVKLDYHPFSLAFSYDVNASKLATASQGRGGVEISLSYIAFVNKENSTKNLKCPKF